MIDVCFSDSTAGILKWCKKEIGSTEILGILLNLDHGYLSDDIIVCQERIHADNLRLFFAEISDDVIEEAYHEGLKDIHSKLMILEKHLKNGESIRLWISNNANDRCCLYWFCDYISKFLNDVFVVLCPGFEPDENGSHFHELRSWASCDCPGLLCEFSSKARLVCPKERQLYSDLWKRIVQENMPLRVLINNKIVSTTEDFFDKAILSFIDGTPKTQSEITGEVLGKWNILNVNFIAERIDSFIHEGTVRIYENKIRDDGCFWSRTLIRIK
ncbi:MAG: DUF3658 domain-containing protein [Oscillospiraceae bacterium]|nr:DUF3658 domain-containing protein [Oscillospiraceae bacterium]